jgi:hypothetical protein
VTTLLVQELKDELHHYIRLSNRERYTIGAIYPYIYMHNSPPGTFTLRLMKDSVELFSRTFSCADIKSALNTTDNYAHVFFPIIPSSPIFLDSGVYVIRLTSSGYVFSESQYIGLIRQHENLNNKLDYVPMSDSEKPMSIRIKMLKRGEL